MTHEFGHHVSASFFPKTVGGEFKSAQNSNGHSILNRLFIDSVSFSTSKLYRFMGEELPPNDPSAAWDGNTRSSPSPNGVYIYSMSLLMEDGVLRQVEGAITLMR